MVIIKNIENGSLAQNAGIKSDDVLVSINGHEINDVLDYRFYLTERKIVLSLLRDGTNIEAVIVKPPYSDIGLEFDTPLMDKKRCCSNKCVFCFIDQNPKGMRETIYFKDDDSRLSFLHGNYITLTNLFDKDVERIIKMRISPVRISVHTTDPELRKKMMKNKRAGEVLSYLKRFADAGLELNAQIVLCKGLNDGAALDRTMTDLLQYVPSLTSVSIVPAGLTKHRDGLYPLSLFSKEEASSVIEQVNKFGEKCIDDYGSRIFFCSDEFYLNAGIDIPDESYYEGYSQIENGVGMLRSFENEFTDEFEYSEKELSLPYSRTVSVATGASAYPMIKKLCDKLCSISDIKVNTYKIINNFYGESVTVSGLLTAGDIYEQLKYKPLGDELLIPANALRADEKIFLDDITLEQLSSMLNIKITPCSEDGAELLQKLLGYHNTERTDFNV